MRVKKLLALALAGMLFATCLSGCDRTIIEHQFHTNTVTDTEYIEVGNSGSQQTLLANFFTLYDIRVVTSLSACDDETFKTTFEPYINKSEIAPAEIKAFYDGKSDAEKRAANIFKIIEYDGTVEGLSSAWAECINALYSAVFTYASDPNNDWNWSQFRENGSFVGLFGVIHELEGKNYCGMYLAHMKTVTLT